MLGRTQTGVLYLHFDGVRYCFKQDPNVTLLIEQEADAVARDEGLVTTQIKNDAGGAAAGHHAAIAWPASSGEIPDEQPRFQIAYLPLDFATKSTKERDALASEFLEKCGSKPRLYKNGLALAIPAADQTESLRREVRYFIAVDRVSQGAKKHNLTKEQTDELRERKATHDSAAESAFVKLYPEVWLPKLDQGNITIEKIAVGGRPLQTTISDRHLAMIFERSMELLTQVQSRVFSNAEPSETCRAIQARRGATASARHSLLRRGERLLLVPWIHPADEQRSRSEDHCPRRAGRGFRLLHRQRRRHLMSPESIRLLETRSASTSPSRMTRLTLNRVL